VTSEGEGAGGAGAEGSSPGEVPQPATPGSHQGSDDSWKSSDGWGSSDSEVFAEGVLAFGTSVEP
jgi:hypothetical protein